MPPYPFAANSNSSDRYHCPHCRLNFPFAFWYRHHVTYHPTISLPPIHHEDGGRVCPGCKYYGNLVTVLNHVNTCRGYKQWFVTSRGAGMGSCTAL
ncbi:uncharacterized protein VTP21DRAFT_76 [Calcarisporiella thermophila]|uniref:uncharacterized protein n=1 Tax=Calcarisporiella thermophila TaxID=911321 RepID=UPI003743C47F